jgi:hypothetical protein
LDFGVIVPPEQLDSLSQLGPSMNQPTRSLTACLCTISVPHPFAFLLAKGWESANPQRTKSHGQRPRLPHRRHRQLRGRGQRSLRVFAVWTGRRPAGLLPVSAESAPRKSVHFPPNAEQIEPFKNICCHERIPAASHLCIRRFSAVSGRLFPSARASGESAALFPNPKAALRPVLKGN